MYPDDEGLNDEGDEFGNDDSQLYVQSPGENGDDGEEKEEDEECETRDLDHFDSADERQSFQPSELRLSALTEEPESEDETDSVQPNYTSDCEHLEAEISEDAIPDTDVDGEEGDDCSVCEDDPAFSSSNFNGAEGEECDAKGFPEDVCENPNLVNEEHYSSGDPLYDSLEVGTEFINMDEDQTLEEVNTRDPLSVLFAHEQQQQDEEEEEIEGEEGEGTELEKAEDTISEEHVYEEAGPDMDGDNLSYFPTDRKSIVTRTRSLSAKMPGYVPETVPEECGPESDPNHTNEYCTVSLDKYGQPFSEGECFDVSRGSTPKSRRFMLYPRSYSVEGRDMPMSVYRENDGSLAEDFRIKRKEDNLSLPCFIGSSGSFSQRSNHPSSGMSTPSSVVDIPPPFELAYITKKPINKSTPSLSTEGDSPDKQKKKKSSFKRFLTFTFKKKTENKVHVDVNVSSSRSSSESSHHGPVRILDMDRRSIGSSPKPVSRSGKTRASDSPSTFLFYKDSKRKGTPKTFSRSVARVESFEDRSRPPFMPLPLTKPRSISFPNADTSDYENIPAINSDYENIQIPPRRPTRTGTFTEFFEDPSRALSSANENDGYVDMSSFTTFESKPQTPDQETERYCKLLCKTYALEPVSGRAVIQRNKNRKPPPDFKAMWNFPEVSLIIFITGSFIMEPQLSVHSAQRDPLTIPFSLFVFKQMNDVLLYTYPQQDGKYRLKNTLSLSGMKISKPFLERYQNALRIDTVGRCLTLSGDSLLTNEAETGSEQGYKLWMGLGEKPPALVPVSHVMMCMNCTSDFTLTIRRHHCHACGKIVCRSCSRNKYPLKYLKDRLAKVCDQCFTELKKRGKGADTTKPVDNLRPRSSRSAGRPLSAVFLSIHPQLLWKPRKSSSPLAQVSALAEGSSMSGPLNRCKKSKRHWKKLWFVLKDKVLYTYMASEDKVATESLPLLGFTVKLFQKEESPEPALVFQLYHKKTLYYTFRAEDTFTARR
uniref:FYVE, RhoGEF and PH domain containing 5 n=1 Tax=Erpetoichthys calabaricus TaxID=27687 RepID=A0A8C4TCM1_ERPCA